MQLIAAIAFRTIASNFKGGGGCETEREREGEGGREGGRERARVTATCYIVVSERKNIAVCVFYIF